MISAEYCIKYLESLKAQLYRLSSFIPDEGSELDKELIYAVSQTLKYIKTLLDTPSILNDEDEVIIHSLVIKDYEIHSPLMFAIFSLSFVLITLKSVMLENMLSAILGIVFIAAIIMLSRMLSRSYNSEIFFYTISGIVLGTIINFTNISIRKPEVTSGIIDTLFNSHLQITLFSTLLIIAVSVICIIININFKVLKGLKRNQLRKVYSIYKNHQKRISELSIMQEF